MLEAIVTAVVTLIANLVYIDLWRKGVGGFTRFVSFWMGTPWSWVSFFMVPEGSQPKFQPPPDDDGRLFREVRRDRLLRERAERRLSAEDPDRGAAAPEL
jgi:hypothetical protein